VKVGSEAADQFGNQKRDALRDTGTNSFAKQPSFTRVFHIVRKAGNVAIRNGCLPKDVDHAC
jgi:hypothetical protein